MNFSVYYFRLLEFFKYYLRSDTIYNIHPPLVYGLATALYQTKPDKQQFACIEKIRTNISNTNNFIKLEDHGAGSSVMKDNVYINHKKIIKTAVSSPKKCEILYKITQYFKPAKFLELGTSLGIATMYFQKAVPEAEILSIEADPTIAGIALSNFEKCNLKSIKLIQNKIDDILATTLAQNEDISMVYIDANHTYEATIRYFNILISCLKEDLVIVFDDIYWSPGMKQAWEEIKNHSKVDITVDLYQIGICILKKGVSKQNFSLIHYWYKPFRLGIFAR